MVRHEDIWGSGGIVHCSFLRRWMKVSSQLRASTVTLTGTRAPVPIGQEVGWAAEPIWAMQRTVLPLAGIGSHGHAARCYTD
jgi:hypothetical protein